MKVAVETLKQTVLAGVAKLGYTGQDAQTIADVLLYAQMRGNNQGITKIATGGVPKASNVQPLKVVKQNKCGALLSGGHSMVATSKAVHLAVDLAREHGVGVVGSNQTFSSSGAIGYFARQIADAGYVGMVCVGTPPFVAPYGSYEPKLGTNPLSYAFPSCSGTVVFDMATSIMAGYGVVEAKLKGEPLPEGVAYDSNGQPTTDAAKTWDSGAIVTFGKHKGFGLSLFVQMIAGPFVGAGFAGLHEDQGSGTFVLAIDPGLLMDKADYGGAVDELLARLQTAKPLDGQQVMLPGEQGDAIAAQAQASGEIEIADAIWNELLAFVES